MKLLAFIVLFGLLAGAACSKNNSKINDPASDGVASDGADTEDQDADPDDVSLADLTAQPCDSVPYVAPAAPDGWQEYRNDDWGYRIVAPAKPPVEKESGNSDAYEEIWSHSFTFTPLCVGQVTSIDDTGLVGISEDWGYVGKRMDKYWKKLLATMNDKFTEPTKKSDRGRPTRHLRFDGTFQGTALKGMGRSIATDKGSILIVYSLWPAEETECAEMGEFFVKSFTPDLD